MNEETTRDMETPVPDRRPEPRGAKAPKPKTMKVENCSKLNVRAEPTNDAEILGTLNRGTLVKVDPSFKDDTFAKVRADFIKDDDAPEFAYLNKSFLVEV